MAEVLVKKFRVREVEIRRLGEFFIRLQNDTTLHLRGVPEYHSVRLRQTGSVRVGFERTSSPGYGDFERWTSLYFPGDENPFYRNPRNHK